jgi:hypothetical protein
VGAAGDRAATAHVTREGPLTVECAALNRMLVRAPRVLYVSQVTAASRTNHRSLRPAGPQPGCLLENARVHPPCIIKYKPMHFCFAA